MKKYVYSFLLLLFSAQISAQLSFANVEASDLICYGECEGNLSITVTGTSGPHTYSIDGGATYMSQNSFNSLCAGSYHVFAQDVLISGAIIDTILVITEPAQIGISSANISNNSCSYGCDGSIEITAVGGTVGQDGYWYMWEDGSGLNSFPNSNEVTSLCPGQYTVVIGDIFECVSDNIDLHVHAAPGIGYYTDIEDISCYGANDGVITFMSTSGGPGASGGTPFAGNNYQFSINEGITFQSSPEFTNLASGVYELIVLDSLGCIAPLTEQVFEPSAISFSVTSSNPTACNLVDGSVTFSGLLSGSTYSFNGFDEDANPLPELIIPANAAGEVIFNGFSGGEISDITVGLNGCYGFLDTIIYLVAPTNGFAMNTGSAAVTAASCANIDGSITGITVSGGSGIYNYSFTGGSSNLDLLNAQPGSYVLTVTDTDGCIIESDEFIINSTTSGISLSSIIDSASCNGDCDGAISTVAVGGDGNYTYTWSNGMLGDNITNVCAGNHTIWVIDGLGCQGVATVEVFEPAVISNTISSVAPSCGSNNGSAEVTASTGGVLPYSYQWSSGSGSALADSLLAGVYSVTVTDDQLCSIIEIVNITSNTSPSITSNFASPTCNGGNNGSIDLTIAGGTAPFSFDWSTGENTEDISNLAAGIYDVTIMDSSGCVVIELFNLSDALPIDLSSFSTVEATCGVADGSISVNAVGGSGSYNYLWSSGGAGAIEQNLEAGTYTLSVSDISNGCLATASYTVSNDLGPIITVDQVIQPACQGGSGEILVSITGGVLPYSYSWSNGANSEDLFNAPVGNYELIVTDSNGCQGVEYSELFGVNLNAAEICMVTVDTASGANLVVWTKEYNLGISQYEIYKETSVLNVFQLLGTLPFDSLTQFVDTAANSGVHSYRYKLRTLDSCSNASEFLAYHKTIHLASNIGLNNVVNLSWDEYIGFSYSTFYINRYHPSTGWEVIDSVASNVYSYTDDLYPSLAGLQYGIEVVPTTPCLAEKAQGHNTTRSNRQIFSGPNPTPNGMNDNQLIDFTLFPNPTDGKFILSFSGELSDVTVQVLDVQGKLLTSFYVGDASGVKEFDISNYEKGMYLIQVSSDDHTKTTRLIKQ